MPCCLCIHALPSLYPHLVVAVSTPGRRCIHALYNLKKKCKPRERLQLIKDAHTSKVVGNFSVGKIVLNLQRNFYRPRMQENVASFIIACILCCRRNLSNMKQGIPPSHAHYLVLNVENIKLFECSMPKYVMENSPLWKGDTSIGSFP